MIYPESNLSPRSEGRGLVTFVRWRDSMIEVNCAKCETTIGYVDEWDTVVNAYPILCAFCVKKDAPPTDKIIGIIS